MALLNITAGATAGGSGSYALTIPGTTAGSVLLIYGVNFGGGTRTVDSNSTGTGTYTQVADNASFLCVWKCMDPQANTTQVRINATGAEFSLVVLEFSGINSAGAVVASSFDSGSTAAWTSPSISPSAASTSVAFCYQGSDNSTTSTITGFTLPSGTGVSSGAAVDASNFAVRMLGTLDIAAGAGQTASGLWGIARAWTTIYVAMEKSTAAGVSDKALLLLL